MAMRPSVGLALRQAVADKIWCTESPCSECNRNVAVALKKLAALGWEFRRVRPTKVRRARRKA